MKAFWRALKTNILAGVLVILPAGATLWLIMTLWDVLDKPLRHFLGLFNTPDDLGNGWIDQVVGWLLQKGIHLGSLANIPGLGLVLTLTIIFLLGLTARSLFGRTFINLGERLVRRLPIFGSLYAAMKQMLEAIFSENSKAFRHAVLIQFPREGIWTIAFMSNPLDTNLTNALPPAIAQANELIFCFIPTTPNPTSGWLVAVNRSEIYPLDISLDDAIKIIISGGIFSGAPTEAAELIQQNIAAVSLPPKAQTTQDASNDI